MKLSTKTTCDTALVEPLKKLEHVIWYHLSHSYDESIYVIRHNSYMVSLYAEDPL